MNALRYFWGGIALLLLSACATNTDIDEAISKLKTEQDARIASISEQVTSITSSLTSLSNTDQDLKALIEELQTAKTVLEGAVKDNDEKITALKAEMTQEASDSKKEMLERLNALGAELQGKLDAIDVILKDLNDKDAALEAQIKTLNEYVNTELKNTKDWASATFSTLEQYNATVTDIAGIKADIEAINQSMKDLETRIDEKIAADIAEAVKGLEEKLKKQADEINEKIENTETELKKWVNTQLTQYYTIAEIDERVKLLERTIKDGDDASAAEIKKLKEDLEAQKEAITTEYQKAISDAITTNNGVIDGKIQDAVDAINTKIDTEIGAIKTQLAEVFSRLESIEASLLDIYGLLKKVYPTSINIISSSNIKMGFGKTVAIDFRVNPSEATFNFDVNSPDCQIELDYLGANTKAGASTRAGYVTNTTHIKLTRVEQMYDENQKKLQGQYRAYITDQREQKKYDDRLGLVLTVPGQSGTDVQISSSAINVMLKVGEITSFSFKASENVRVLQENLLCDIDDNMISGRIPHIVDGKKLVPTIKFEGEGKLVLHALPEQDINTETDFSRSVVYDVIDEETKDVLDSYEVNISAFTGLPVMNIYTENDAPIVSKDDYLNAKIEIKDYSSGKYNLALTDVQIKGRGNSTWGMPKKPYALKFGKKTQLFGESNSKQWVLLANYSDKTSIRTSTAFYMGELSNLEWTPCSHFVDLFINKQYQGTYQLTEKIKIAKDRVNVTDDGFLLEVDAPDKIDASDVYFSTTKIVIVNIKEPEIETGSEKYEWIRDKIQNIENVLFGDGFLDVNGGYKDFIDIESFVDWYLINEIAKNNDALFYSSCYMNIAPDGKLKMGPLWDFDISLGNINYRGNYNPEGFYIKKADWIKRMFEDPVFVSSVRERFDFYKTHLNDIYSHINSEASYLKYSVVENNNKWGVFYTYTWPNYAIWGKYQNEVEYMKQFLTQRMEWLDAHLPR